VKVLTLDLARLEAADVQRINTICVELTLIAEQQQLFQQELERYAIR
jgi:hypothetical protein